MYFYTERGFLGPELETVRARDRIYIVQGALVPYIFRHQDNVLDLEREAYVYGMALCTAKAWGWGS